MKMFPTDLAYPPVYEVARALETESKFKDKTTKNAHKNARNDTFMRFSFLLR